MTTWKDIVGLVGQLVIVTHKEDDGFRESVGWLLYADEKVLVLALQRRDGEPDKETAGTLEMERIVSVVPPTTPSEEGRVVI